MLTIRQFTFNPLQENTYLVYNETGDCAIVDPGCYFGNERKELTDFIEAHNLSPKCLLNTHCHLDHVFGNAWAAKVFGLQPQLHIQDKPVLDDAPHSGQRWGLPFDGYYGAVTYLKEGDEVSLGHDVFQVLFTPGHSPGSISFYCPQQRFVLAGDVLFRESIGRTDLPGGDFDTLMNSIRRTLFSLPDDVVVYAGHGPETTIGHEKQHNPFLHP